MKKSAEDKNHYLTDGHMTLVIMPWDITDYDGTGIITQGMDHTIIIEAFLIVIIGGLGNIWGALLGALIFGLTDAIGILILPQFAIVFPYAAVVLVLLFRPKGLLKSTW